MFFCVASNVHKTVFCFTAIRILGQKLKALWSHPAGPFEMVLQCKSATCVPNFPQLLLHLPPAPHPLPLFSPSPPLPLPPTLPLPLNNCSWLALWSWPWRCCCGQVLWGGLHLQWRREGNAKASANQTDRRKQGVEEAERSRSRLDHQTHLKSQVERKFLWGRKYSFRHDKLFIALFNLSLWHQANLYDRSRRCSHNPLQWKSP